MPDEKDFKKWIEELDECFLHQIFIGYLDVEDENWHQIFMSGDTPEEAFEVWYDKSIHGKF